MSKTKAVAEKIYNETSRNREYEPLFRRKSFEVVKLKWSESETITKTDLRVMVREFVGCSSQSSYSYVERLFAPEIGPLIEDEDNHFFVRFRYHKDLNLSIEDLEAKFPKSGQRFARIAVTGLVQTI